MTMSVEVPSSVEIADLLTSLVEGSFEAPPWSGFLEKLRHATGAEYAILVVHPPGRRMDDGLLLYAGGEQASEVAELYRKCLYPSDRQRREVHCEGKAVSLASLRDTLIGQQCEAYWGLVEWAGIVGSRLVRVSEPNGVEAWLVIARKGRDFAAKDTALLTQMIAALRGVLRSHVAAEKGRFQAKMSAEAVRRMHCGWFLFDQFGHVLSADDVGDTILARSGVLSRSKNGRLLAQPANLEREILQLIAELASGVATRPRAISLRGDPWLDMLLVPARRKFISETAVPAVIAYVHGDNWRTADRCGQLCDLFELSPSEARLALALCRGRSIAEAAIDLDLRLETARSYSKSIYAKTGTRGMADLVRVVMGSVLTLAPDT